MMPAFWIIAGLLAFGVLLLLLRPLLRRPRDDGPSRNAMNAAVYRDQLRELENDVASGTLSRAGYEEARGEIERRLLDDVEDAEAPASSHSRSAVWRAVITIGVPLPAAAFAVYFFVGSPQVMLQGGVDAGAQAQPRISPEQLKAMVVRLAERMEREPEDVEGWIMLGRSYRMLEEFGGAARAYANAVERSEPDANLLADYAEMLAMAQGRNLAGEPERILQRALAVDSHNAKALALSGAAAFERRDYTAATDYWERIAHIIPPDSELARSVRGRIEEARALAKGSETAAGRENPAKRAPAAAAATVSGTVELAPALAAQAAPADTLFVFARATEGPRMPLSIVRAQVKDLPLRFTLDDSSAMAPGMNLSSHKRVIVGARISRSGNASPQPGDLEGYSAAVDVGAAGIQITINSRVP
jgi:cytochrome c-type biogenesis protein CcmH